MTEAKKKIAIVGTAVTSCADAPYGDDSWRIWSIAKNFILNQRFDIWFELHTLDALRAAQAAPQYFDFLKATGQKVMMGIPQAELPDAVPYPINEIKAEFGDYFTSSASYMIALAIYFKADEIGCWGIDMVEAGEYAHQRACCEYYLGIAVGRGIKVTMAPQSPLLRTNAMYAFDNPKLSREMTERLVALEAEEKRLRHVNDTSVYNLNRIRAQLEQIKDINHRWGL